MSHSKRPIAGDVHRTRRRNTSSGHRLGVTITAVLVVTAMGLTDFFTGPTLGFSLFYLLPVAVVSWQIDRASGVLVAFAASLAWLIADIPLRYENELISGLWNGITRAFIFTGAAVLISRVRADQDRLTALVQTQARLARTDPLTGLSNARALMEYARIEVARSRRHHIPVCLAYLDVDNFKRVNDTYGHAEGDGVLHDIAEVLRGSTRAEDLAARIGGDEFALFLFGIEPNDALVVGHRLVDAVVAMREKYPGTDLGTSVGMYHCQVAPEDAEELIRNADRAMYVAKAAGKNRVELVREPMHSDFFERGEALRAKAGS
ncbi:MAG: GGDEF domain-containing protein [Myxococcota bacterium]